LPPSSAASSPLGSASGRARPWRVNAIQGIETTLEPLPGVVGRVADAHAQVNEHLQDTAGLLDAVAALEKFRWEQTFEGATIQEKINLLREKEMQLNNAALDATLQTAEGIRAQLEAERARAQINELLAELAEQEAASQSDAAGEERERLQTTRERAQATQTALAAELSGQQSITRELAEQAQLAERKLAAAKEHMIVSQVFNGPSTADLFAKSDAELQQMARVLQGDIAHTQSTFRRPWGFVGDAPGTGTLQNQLDRIQGELAERQRFAQVYGMAGDSRFSRDRFAPAEFERRLAQFNQGTEKIDETNALLRDIRAHVRPEPIIISGTPGG
jgi:chemotaxis protein histidine kinase CheA